MASKSIHFFNFINLILPSAPCFGLRRSLLRMCGAEVSNHVSINTRVSFYWHNISIGESTWVGPECRFFSTSEAAIKIGARCDFGPNVTVVTGTHDRGDANRRAGAGRSFPVLIGDGCWIGAGALILGGAKIGPGSVIGAGAVVRQGQYPDNCLLAGVPATVKRILIDGRE
jgi:maltose O-acetyltransferase